MWRQKPLVGASIQHRNTLFALLLVTSMTLAVNQVDSINVILLHCLLQLWLASHVACCSAGSMYVGRQGVITWLSWHRNSAFSFDLGAEMLLECAAVLFRGGLITDSRWSMQNIIAALICGWANWIRPFATFSRSFKENLRLRFQVLFSRFLIIRLQTALNC